MIWVSKSNPSVLFAIGSSARAATLYARYPEWNSLRFDPSSEFSIRVRMRLPTHL